MNPTNINSNQPTNNPQGGTMKNSDTNNADRILVWRKPDGTIETGTYADLGGRYYVEGYGKEGHSLKPAVQQDEGVFVPDVSADLVEDVEDEDTVEAPIVRLSTPTLTASQPEPVTVTPRTAEDTQKAHQMARDYIESRGGETRAATWFPPGTEMMDVGKDTYRMRARLHADSAPVREEWQPVIDKVCGENRRMSGVVDLSDCRITDASQGGGFAIYQAGKGKTPMDLEWMAVEQLIGAVSKAMPGSLSRMLHTMPRGEFVDLVNRQLARAGDHVSSTDARIQHRTHNGRRSAFSVVSPSYMPMPLDHILTTAATELERIGDRLGFEARGEVRYNPTTTLATYKATWHAPESFAARVGDPVEVGLKGGTGGAGNGFHRLDQQLTLIRCINCTLMTWAALALKRRHSGSKTRSAAQNLAVGMSRVRADVFAVVDGLEEGVQTFGGLWGILKDTPINAVALAGDRHTDVREALEAMVEKGQIGKGIARDALVESLVGGFNREPGDSLADLVNAVTRAAHEGMVSDIQQWQMERDAGDLMVVLAQKAQPEALKALTLGGE